ncbi:hypothetical protein MASR2M66_08690 [Chloroflexota bacterium]
MSKYQSARKVEKVKSNQPHYAWRGIGCIMMIVIPAVSIAAGVETIKYALANRWAVPVELLGYPRFPDLFYKSSGIMQILSPVARIQHFYAFAAAGLFYTILLGAILSMLYAVIDRMTRPSQYGPLDAPPSKTRSKPYKR